MGKRMGKKANEATSTRASDVDEYLARVPEDARAALVKLRKTIKAAVPKAATEVISYQIPAYKHHGLLVGFAASNGFCTFHIMSTGVTTTHAEELKSYKTGKASIRFAPNNPPPAALVKKLIKARVAENEAGRSYRQRKSE